MIGHGLMEAILVIRQHSFPALLFIFSHFLRLLLISIAITPHQPLSILYSPPPPVVVKSINFVLVTVIYKMVEFFAGFAPPPLLCVCVCVCEYKTTKNTITSLIWISYTIIFHVIKQDEAFFFFNFFFFFKYKFGKPNTY